MSVTAVSQCLNWWSGEGTWPDFKRQALKAAVVAVSYWTGAEIAFFVGTLSDKIFAPFWPPNIVLMTALVLSRRRNWWIYILATFPAHAIAEHSVGMRMAPTVVAFGANCLVAVLNAIAIQSFLRGPSWFSSLHQALLYIIMTALLCPALAALVGAFVPIIGGAPGTSYWTFWLQWYLANALSSLTLGPVALIALSERKLNFGASINQKIEATILGITLALGCIIAFHFGTKMAGSILVPGFAYLPLTLVIWCAIRFGVNGAAAAILIATTIAIAQVLDSRSASVISDPETAVLGLQIFLIGLAAPVLLLGAATQEARNAISSARRNEELMTLSAEAADACLWQYDRRENRFWMTEHGRTMFGLSADAPLTRVSIMQSIHPDDRAMVIDAMRLAALTNELADNEFRVVRPDGEISWIRARGRARASMLGAPTILSGTFTNVTDHKIADQEAALQRSELAHVMRVSMLGELSGGIAHELTQPLTAILSNAQAARVLMNSRPPDMAEIMGALDDIISDDNRAGEVLHRMRRLLKSGEGKFEAVDLNEIIRSTMQLLHSETVSRRVRFTCEFDKALPLVGGDPVQLQQVLLNLFMNAFDSMNDFSPSRRMITVSTRPLDDGEVEIRVADQGSGLSPAQQERIFQPFFTTKARGLGLGLSICSSIIKSHGGTLSLANNSTGGVTASVKLPIRG